MSTRIDAEQDKPGQIINCARMNRLVIRCINDPGQITDMIHSGVDGLWIIAWEPGDDLKFRVVDQRINESLRNHIKIARPDVSLIEQSNSLFAGEEKNDG